MGNGCECLPGARSCPSLAAARAGPPLFFVVRFVPVNRRTVEPQKKTDDRWKRGGSWGWIDWYTLKRGRGRAATALDAAAWPHTQLRACGNALPVTGQDVQRRRSSPVTGTWVQRRKDSEAEQQQCRQNIEASTTRSQRGGLRWRS